MSDHPSARIKRGERISCSPEGRLNATLRSVSQEDAKAEEKVIWSLVDGVLLNVPIDWADILGRVLSLSLLRC
jgi:hypothetical protein